MNDKTRNYHDEHHKPELIAALTDFYALRGGLTPKHVNIEELLKILTFTYGKPDVLEPHSENDDTGSGVYDTSLEEFELWRRRLDRVHSIEGRFRHSIQLGIVTEGSLSVARTDETLSGLNSGNTFMTPCDFLYRVSSATGATVFLVNVPSDRETKPQTSEGGS